MMKRITNLAVLLGLLTSMSILAQPAIGLKGIGPRVGFISVSEDVGSTFDIGVVANLGTLLENVQLVGSFDTWGKSEDENGASASTRDFVLAGGARYAIPMEGDLQPYATGGLALHIYRGSVEIPSINFDESDTDLRIGLDIGGGVVKPLNSGMDVFGEILIRINEVNQYLFSVGVMFDMGG